MGTVSRSDVSMWLPSLLAWLAFTRETSRLSGSQQLDRFLCPGNRQRHLFQLSKAAEMDDLVQAAREEIDPALRKDIYAQIQELWANELPTLDISQEPRRALSLTKVDGVGIDALGMLHYELLTKNGG